MGGSDESKFDHPTQKPVDLMRRPILNHVKRGEAVYDPFLGSGTTLAAAELTERVCFGLELDPKYADVIVQRWQTFSGKKAKFDGDGRTFEEIARERKVAPGIARCRREIAEIEAQIRSGHPDLQGLLRGLVDWSSELRRLLVAQNEKSRRGETPAANGTALGECQAFTEYRRSPSSALTDATVSAIFLLTVPDKYPRTECGCQPVAFISSLSVAPSGLFSSARTFAALLPSPAPSPALGGFAPFGFLGAFSPLLDFFPDLLLPVATRDFRALRVPFLLAFGSSAGATTWAVASDSIFGVFIVSAPFAVITAVRISITLLGNGSKRILTPKGDRKAMLFAAR
jgi:DNA methylase